jgi:hypothetical protein
MDEKAAELFHAGRDAWLGDKVAEAIPLLRAALERAPGNAAMEAGLGAALLKSGDLSTGFPLFDRWRALRPSAPALPYPRWSGQDVAGKRVLVWSEHGLGDQMQWARYAVALVRAGASVSWVCPRALASLIADLGIEALPDDQSVTLSGFHYYCPSSALPLGFRLSIEAIDGSPYLIRPRPDHRGARLGVMTTVNAANVEGRPRALNEEQANRLRSVAGSIDLAPETTGAKDFRDTAAIVSALELVITVDTSVAHLAGGLGIPTVVVLPFAADWRWFIGRLDSPWYSSVRLVRQGPDLDWETVVDRALSL